MSTSAGLWRARKLGGSKSAKAPSRFHAGSEPASAGFERGLTDGSCVDAEGFIWNCRVAGGGCVVRFAPADGSAGEPVAGSRCSTPFHAARRKPTLVGYSGHRTLSILSQAYPPSATLYCNSPGRITRVFPTSGAGVLISVSPTRGGFNTPSQSSSFSERFFWFVSSPEATRQRSLSSAFAGWVKTAAETKTVTAESALRTDLKAPIGFPLLLKAGEVLTPTNQTFGWPDWFQFFRQ